jgi:hypothetical protein
MTDDSARATLLEFGAPEQQVQRVWLRLSTTSV